MKIVKQNDWVEVLNNGGSVGNLILSETHFEIVHLQLEPGSVIPLHALPVDVSFFVLEGTPTFVTDEEEIAAGVNESIFCEANKNRSWKNNSDATAKVIVIKAKG